MDLASLQIEIKRNKTIYYLRSLLRQTTPRWILRNVLKRKLRSLGEFATEEIFDRVDYYNKLLERSVLDNSAVELGEIRNINAPSAYLFDALQYTRYFPHCFKAAFLLGDVIHVADKPCIQKSRPILPENTNGILLNLDKKRHFLFINDPIPYEKKLNLLIGRGGVTQPHRIAFMDKYFGEPMLDLGQTNVAGGNPAWIKPKISIYEHLKYKFILSLEGNDVATNLKWIMSSNSIAVMPKPKYETWFMEGRLRPNFHYILIKDNYSDLIEVLKHYIANPTEAKEIVRNANEFVKQFQDREKEDLISLLTLEKYFFYTSQIDRLTR